MNTYTAAAIMWGVASVISNAKKQVGRGILYALVCMVLFNMPL